MKKKPSKEVLLENMQDRINNSNYFTVEAEVEENGQFFQWRKYTNAGFIKDLGGIYANWCDNGNIKFYKNAYLRDRAYSKFVDENSEVK